MEITDQDCLKWIRKKKIDPRTNKKIDSFSKEYQELLWGCRTLGYTSPSMFRFSYEYPSYDPLLLFEEEKSSILNELSKISKYALFLFQDIDENYKDYYYDALWTIWKGKPSEIIRKINDGLNIYFLQDYLFIWITNHINYVDNINDIEPNFLIDYIHKKTCLAYSGTEETRPSYGAIILDKNLNTFLVKNRVPYIIANIINSIKEQDINSLSTHLLITESIFNEKIDNFEQLKQFLFNYDENIENGKNNINFRVIKEAIDIKNAFSEIERKRITSQSPKENPETWGFPKGRAQGRFQEKIEDTIKRELREEVGKDLFNKIRICSSQSQHSYPPPLFVSYQGRDGKCYYQYFYLYYKYDESEPELVFEREKYIEIVEAKFVPLIELNDYLFYETGIDFLHIIKGYIYKNLEYQNGQYKDETQTLKQILNLKK